MEVTVLESLSCNKGRGRWQTVPSLPSVDPVSLFASPRRYKWFTIPVANCRLLRGAISTVPSTIRALQPENNARNVIAGFREPCRLINRDNSTPGTSINRFVTHFWFPCFCFKKPCRLVTLKTQPGRALPIRREVRGFCRPVKNDFHPG